MRYAVMTPDGELADVVDDVSEAVSAASHYGARVQVEGGEERGLAGFGELGRMAPERLPEVALMNSGLSVIDLNSVMRMSLEEAYAKLVGFFPKSKTRKTGEVVPVAVYTTVSGMVDGMLGQNYKTAKETPEDPTDVQGLSLLPYNMGKSLSKRSLGMRGLGFCVGSSEACRRACLVYSGHNVIDIYNQVVKVARTEALCLEPRAFVRVLVAALKKHFEPARGLGDWEPLVRLNVFSDVPWELVCPGLFEMFSEGQFYDYTKVPGRETPENYDLTFSWSGSNDEYVYSEMDRGRRIAVVFLTEDRKVYNKWRKTKDKAAVAGAGLPVRFLGRSVVDGDISDVRPRDPGDCVVGLRWKPHGLGKKVGADPASISAFVVPCKEIDGVLVASESSRMSPITDPDEELS